MSDMKSAVPLKKLMMEGTISPIVGIGRWWQSMMVVTNLRIEMCFDVVQSLLMRSDNNIESSQDQEVEHN